MKTKWKSKRKLPKILKINSVKGFVISVLFSDGHSRVIDFEKVFVFDEAVVFVCILEFRKQIFTDNLRAVTIKDNNELSNFKNEFINKSIKIESISLLLILWTNLLCLYK